ncbi:tripeptidyl-peptidase II Tpp2, partial [Kappamyces sp. JEL0680]
YKVTLGGTDQCRGIYLREPETTATLQEYTLQVDPYFARDQKPETNITKAAFEVHLELVVSAGAEHWVMAPSFCALAAGGKTFPVRVDARQLPPGLHRASIAAFDASNKAAGPLFEVPVTVMKPESVDSPSLYKFSTAIAPTDIVRKFISVPLNANFADFTLSFAGPETPSARFCVSLLQRHPQSIFSTFHNDYRFNLADSGADGASNKISRRCAVLGGATMEICLAGYWSSAHVPSASFEIKFHSILVSASSKIQSNYGAASGNGGNLLLGSGLDGITRLDIQAPIRRETISPKLELTSSRTTLRSTNQELSPLGERDVLPTGKRVHQLVLTYSFAVSEATKVKVEVPRFQGSVYDSELESLMVAVFDANKKRCSIAAAHSTAKKLDEGDYTVRVQIASSDLAWLGDLKATQIVVEKDLAKPVTASFYHLIGEVGKGTPFKSRVVSKGKKLVLWLGELTGLPKSVKPGDVLVGSLSVTDDLDAKLFTCSYVVPPEFTPKKIEVEGQKLPPKSDETLAMEAVRDLEISWIKKMKKDDERLAYMHKLETRYETHLPLQLEKLAGLSDMATKEKSLSLANTLLECSQSVLKLFQQQEVAIYFGVHRDLSAGNEKDLLQKKEMETKRELLAAAYAGICTAYRILLDAREASAYTPNESNPLETTSPEQAVQAFDEALAKLASWSTPTPLESPSYLVAWAWSQKRKGLHGSALLELEKYLKKEKKPSAGLRKECVELKLAILKALNWSVWYEEEEMARLANNPVAYAKF